jgi:LysM repeat protein
MTPFAHVARRAGTAAILVGTAVLAAACASSNNGGTAASAPSSSSAAATPSQAATSSAPQASSAASAPAPSTSAGTAACATGNLKATVVTGQGGAAAGSTYYPVNLTNTGSSSCSLFGYPGVSWVTSPSGNQIGQPARRNPVVTPATVVLAPGQTAHVTLQVVDAQNYSKSACQPVTAHWLKIYPPGQFTALYVKFSALTCSAKLPTKDGLPLSVDAVKAGKGTAGGGL